MLMLLTVVLLSKHRSLLHLLLAMAVHAPRI